MPNADQRFAPLYDGAFEHDACGVGLVVDIHGRASREIVTRALAGLVNLTHRGGVGADERTGDGAGLLTQIPVSLLAPDLSWRELGVAITFLPRDPEQAEQAQSLLAQAMTDRSLIVRGWREVPVDSSVLGRIAAETQPAIAQLLVERPAGVTEDEFERDLMLARKAAERATSAAGIDDFFVVSCSCRTIIYKGFCLPEDLAAFYLDLQDPSYTSAIALFHQRYSTNTLPTWAMAQPFRYIAHNGEINTIQGNRLWMQARRPLLEYPGIASADELEPLVSMTGSDSLSLDNVVELLYHGGRSLPHALMMLVPEPWERMADMEPARRAFYDYHAGLNEQWDGPAALAFSDGVLAGATLDRNGLRPLRYAITSDGLLIAGSEAGTVEVDQSTVIEKGRLGPGQMIVVDTRRGVVLRNPEIKSEVAGRQPFAEWLNRQRVNVDRDTSTPGRTPVENLTAVQASFGYSAEDARLIIQPMAAESKEPTWSMGDDAPLAVLSERPRPLSAYFRQRFAQVTNPPIDSLRERSVLSLDTFIGPRGNLLIETEEKAELIRLQSVVITESQLKRISKLNSDHLRAATISTLFALNQTDLPTALDALLGTVREQVLAGATVLVLSDRGVDESHATIPMLLAVGAIHNDLIRAGMRMAVDFVCETGEVWDVHHLACLIGYSASAVHPYLALQASGALAGTRGHELLSVDELQRNYISALEKGLLKITSRMGISTVMGYLGAQIFETIGLGPELVEFAFAGTPARLGGIGLAEIETDIRRRHEAAWTDPAAKLADPGFVRFRKDGEHHGYSPTVAKALQAAATSGNLIDFRAYHDMVREHPPTAVRDLIEIKPLGDAIPLDEVEPADEIVKRFVVTAMSLGALSPEAFQTLAVAMNRIGARSNSGEGGEDPEWYEPTGADIGHSKVKQVASGRFGVTARYLAMAEELEIKMAQGSKPGEGGQLPGHKVTDFIARMRHAVPGLPLISPPPHHDIYSIEDLAQLIYDLRQVNPSAKVGVKLVSVAGVGTIAAGVAKARADYILISGHSGGTGASPLASIKYAGSPWELGLAEAQQVLVMNGLRSRVRLRTDGGIKTPEDVVIATLFGAEEYGFGTSVLISIGCDMARQCHLNTCPTGIATQKEELRKRFAGTPEMVINYMMMLAEGVRELMASLGIRQLDEIVGRTDLLTQRSMDGRAGMLDLDALFAEPAPEKQRRKMIDLDPQPETLDQCILATVGAAIEVGGSVDIADRIETKDRTVGARIAGRIALAQGVDTLKPGTVTARFTGSAGQSFGAFAVGGMRLILEGEANDYVGKGMAGGEIAILPPRTAPFMTPQVIAGNTILYGATGGSLFVAGKAGERFAVRNSGATAVVEGVGDHGCEYMTGGTVVVLGPTGRNFGAGMTNGLAFVVDEQEQFWGRANEDVILERTAIDDPELTEMSDLIEQHIAFTQSAHAKRLLANWSETVAQTWKVIPAARIELQRQQQTTETEATAAD
jgi:glutamate synthase domain-containing protein 2/glutamate synthase domain-containing protein 1/glutamate synthase domain-containing protein 3